MKRRVHVFYSGAVQGVGFRFTAIRVAKSLGIKGWVKNLHDGRVEVVAEAEEKQLQKLLDNIKTSPLKHFINHIDLKWEEFQEEFNEFDIRF